MFNVADIQKEYRRLVDLGVGLGVGFGVKPTAAGAVTISVFNDPCGNNIQPIRI